MKEQPYEIESDPAYRERLERETIDLLIGRAKVLLAFSAPFFLFYWGLDWVTTRAYIFAFLIIRVCVVTNYIVGLILLYSRHGRKIVVPLTIWEAFISIFGVSIMTSLLGGFTSFYYVGIIFILFVTGLFFPWSPRQTIIAGGISTTSYLLTNLIQHYQTTNLFVMFQPLFFMVGAVAITAFANVGNRRTQRSNLKLRMQVEKANEDLKELDKAKMRFFSNVSHELRSPLTLILGPLEAMLQGQSPLGSRPLLEAMDTNARRLLRQVNTLLDFAKIDAGKLECKFAYGNVGRVLAELYVATRPHAERRKITLALEEADQIPDSIMDVNKVETIAANLISNAVKFTPDGGRIAIRAGFDDDSVWFEVEDTGPGIPEDQLGRLFERFLQLDDALSRRAEGTGLGLAMVKELTKLHGGIVEVRSQVGVGTTFTVELPRRPEVKPLDRRRIIGRRKIDQFVQERTISMLGLDYEERSGTKTLLADVAASKLGGGVLGDVEIEQQAPPDAQKVLVVDDNPDIRTFIASNLVVDYRIAMAGDGVEALEVAHRFQPDLIISDIMMPRMDGYEFCRQVRKDQLLGQIPIILATSKTGGEAVVEGLETGANDYLSKPFEIRELKARVAAHLRARRLERNLNERESRLAAIGQMTSSIVHDLKNPLSNIVGFAEICREDAASGNVRDLAHNLEPVISEANRLTRMIMEVLDFARGYSADVKMEPTMLVPYLSLITATWKNKLEQIGISLVVNHRIPDKLQVTLDPDRMIRVIENLLKNAQEALYGEGRDPKGKHIWLSTEANEQTATIRIVDDGPGIAEDVAARLFEPFATAGKTAGTGLGLATARNLVKAQGGEISVIPKSREGGAAFVLTFPIKA